MEQGFVERDFQLYEILLHLRYLSEDYPVLADKRDEIEECLNLIRTRKYVVAVAGEFKRGKSTMLNALLGAKILPAKCTPTTATVNRITYGAEPALRICYRDGTEELCGIQELSRYVTKTTEEQEKMAASEKEAVVSYPTVLCQNHIDVIDTPGLNDDEKMTAVTAEILQHVDAVIFTVSALAPLSQFEIEWILRLVENPAIEHLIFVMTYADCLEEEELEDMKAFFRKKAAEIAVRAEAEAGDNSAAADKAHRILGSMDLFAISSTQALEAFQTGDNALLKKSGFPIFKQELYRILTSRQGLHVSLRTGRLLEVIRTELEQLIVREKERILKKYPLPFQDGSRIKRDDLLLAADRAMEEERIQISQWFSEQELFERLWQVYRRQLSAVSKNRDDLVVKAVRAAEAECLQMMKQRYLTDRQGLLVYYRKAAEHCIQAWTDCLIRNYGFVLRQYPDCGKELEQATARLAVQPFPVFRWRGQMVPKGVLSQAETSAHVQRVLWDSLKQWEQERQAYDQFFRKTVFQFLAELTKRWESILKQVETSQLASRKAEMEETVDRHLRHKQRLDDYLEQVKRMNQVTGETTKDEH